MGGRAAGATATAGTPVPITTSAGVATFPLHAGDAATLVRVADEALYGSKRNGRNRVTRAGWGWSRRQPSGSMLAQPADDAIPAPADHVAVDRGRILP